MSALPVAAAALAALASGAALLARALRRSWLAVTVRGQSMQPTFRDGQRLRARRLGRGERPRVGDVVVFALSPAQRAGADGADPAHRVKRVAATAGAPVPPWLASALPAAAATATVPAGHLVVRGDNPRSEDSRHFGFVAESAVLAVVAAPAAPAPPAPGGVVEPGPARAAPAAPVAGGRG